MQLLRERFRPLPCDTAVQVPAQTATATAKAQDADRVFAADSGRRRAEPPATESVKISATADARSQLEEGKRVSRRMRTLTAKVADRNGSGLQQQPLAVAP